MAKALNQAIEKDWTIIHGDCCEAIKGIPDESIHYSIFSPPFASLYTYSASERDMGNCKDYDAFFQHMTYLAKDLARVIKPGRNISIHCMNLPTSKERHGYIGIQDFRGDLIRIFQRAGLIFHSEVCIWKDPVTAMQRTKALGLLYKQLRKDSCMSRQGIPDYLVTMRKPGENAEPVTKVQAPADVDPRGMEIGGEDGWQSYASPVWMDINPSKTLDSIREEQDEKHICPLQLEVIERGIRLWSNPGDVVLSPFTGIGSEGYVSICMGRKFLGIELKEAYYKQACINLKRAEQKAVENTLFGANA